MLSPRQRLLEVLRNTPDAQTTMTEEDQFTLVDKVRQTLYEQTQSR
jgi:hypothetical protein